MVTSNKKTKPSQSRRADNLGAKVNADFAAGEQRFLEKFPNDRACLDYLMALRVSTRDTCPKCNRAAKFHKIRQIPAYACQWCGYHLHPMATTRFARSRVGLQVWFHAVFLYSNSRNGVTTRELQHFLDLTYKTAWRIRNTIIDVKFNTLRQDQRSGPPDFETLLDALTNSSAPIQSKRTKPRRRSSAA